MKKFISFAVIIIALMAMSFTKKSTRYFVVQDGHEVAKIINNISDEELQVLQEISVFGAKTTNWFTRKVWENIAEETIHKNTDPAKLSDESLQRLNEIFSKYGI